MWTGVILRSKTLRRVVQQVIVSLLLALAAELGGRRETRDKHSG